MEKLYPLMMAPYFRHGADTPWGGHMLRDAFLKDAPEDVTGNEIDDMDLAELNALSEATRNAMAESAHAENASNSSRALRPSW